MSVRTSPETQVAPVARTWRHPRQREVVLVGVLLVAVGTGFRIWALQGVWFFFDDFYFIQRAMSSDLTVAYLFRPYNSHLMPAGMLLNWLNARHDPLDFTLPAVEIIVGFALFGLVTFRLLLRLFGARWGVLVPLVMVLFSPILLPSTTWWAAAVNQLPMMVATVLALDAFVRYLRDPAPRHLVANVLWLVVGLLFVERTLLTLGLFWLIALLYFSVGTVPERLGETWRRYRPAIVTHVVVVVGYLAYYVPNALDFNATTLIRRPFFEVVHDLAITGFSAGFPGGPLEWQVSQVTQNEAHPGPLFLFASQTLLVLLVLATVRTRERGLRAWLLPVYVLGANIGLISVSRAIYFGPEIALDYRFQTEVALSAALAVGLAFMPLVGARESSAPRDSAPIRLETPAWALPAVAVFVALAVISTNRFPLRHLTDTSPRRYLDNVAASAKQRPDAQLLNAPTPRWMWAPLAFPTNTYEYMFRALRLGLDVRTAVTDHAYLVDEHGRFQPIEFTKARDLEEDTPATDDAGRCKRELPAGSSTWSLDGPVFGIGWVARVAYSTDEAQTLRVVTDGNTARVRLQPGEHVALVPVIGTFHEVDLRLPADASGGCLLGLQIGSLSTGS